MTSAASSTGVHRLAVQTRYPASLEPKGNKRKYLLSPDMSVHNGAWDPARPKTTQGQGPARALGTLFTDMDPRVRAVFCPGSSTAPEASFAVGDFLLKQIISALEAR